jgi:hypothetical protein
MKRLLPLFIVSSIIVFSSQMAQAVVQIDIGANGPAGNRWELGTGWGTAPGQLDAVFNISNSLPSQSFVLNNVGDHHSFRFGSVELCESYIDADETNNLGVRGFLYFDLPPIGGEGVPGQGLAFTGSVSDWYTDLKIEFDPIYVNFDTCGKLKIELSDLCFTCDETQYVDACVTLCQQPCPPVPEPATLVIWSLFGGIGLVFAWRKRKSA